MVLGLKSCWTPLLTSTSIWTAISLPGLLAAMRCCHCVCQLVSLLYLSPYIMFKNTHTHTRTHTHTHTHTLTHTHSHSHSHTLTHTHQRSYSKEVFDACVTLMSKNQIKSLDLIGQFQEFAERVEREAAAALMEDIGYGIIPDEFKGQLPSNRTVAKKPNSALPTFSQIRLWTR